ncbi:MAG TPA: hypothetical protein VFY22_10830, partial [Hydrogenophaga sp.]|nr:hypothetical protein [Hydrogenophaga sp.]
MGSSMRDASSGNALSDTMEVNDETQAPDASWLSHGDGWVLQLSGDWRGHRGPLPDLPAPANSGAVAVDAEALHAWDAGLAAQLWQQLDPLARRSVSLDLQGLPQGLREVLVLALHAAPDPAPGRPKPDQSPLGA